MLIKFLARDMRTNLEYEFVTPVNPELHDWERQAWRDIVKTWTLPNAVQPVEWKQYAERNNRLRNSIQQETVPEKAHDNGVHLAR